MNDYDFKDDVFFSYEIQPNDTEASTVIEWDENVSETDKWDYIFATASGTIAGALDILISKNFSLASAHTWGAEKINDFVMTVARMQGSKAGDLKGAIRDLEKSNPFVTDSVSSEFGSGLQHHNRDFAHHASLGGLIFSIFTHLTGICVGTDVNGLVKTTTLPEGISTGKNLAEQLYNGIVGWATHLISDMAGSSSTPGAGTGIMGPILSRFKILSSAPVFQFFKVKYKSETDTFSQIVSKLFNGTAMLDADNKPIPFDLRTEVGIVHQNIIGITPVLINECLVRAFYSIRRFFLEVQEVEISSIEDLKSLNWKRILPFNNRTIKRMLTVSSGVLVSITTAKAAIKAAATSPNWIAYLVNFAININYPGVFRFTAALFADSRYMIEDTKELCNLIIQKYKLREPKPLVNVEKMFLSKEHSRLLYSLKLQEILYDIEHTKNKKHLAYKQEWLYVWKAKTLLELNESEDYFLNKESLFEKIKESQNSSASLSWLNLITLESLFFVPYYPIEGIKSKKLISQCSDFEKDILATEYNLVYAEILDKIKVDYKKYVNFLDERNKKKLTAAIATHAILLPVPGVILPDLILLTIGAVEIAKCVDTILGDGSLYGFLGANISIFTSNGIVLNECAKLLTYCSCFLAKNDQQNELELIKSALEYRLEEANCVIKRIEIHKNKDNKATLINYKKSAVYLKKSIEVLNNM